MLKIKSLGLFLFLIAFSTLQQAQAQNYWGDNPIQPLEKNPNTFEIKQISPPVPKGVTELPEAPETKDSGTFKVSSPIVKSQTKSPVLEIGAKTEKIPIGTKLKIVFNTNLNAKKSKLGDPFSATIKDDIYVDGSLILPAGTLIRGRVGKVKKPGIFSRSGSIVLDFDHFVTPLGSQLNLDIDLTQNNKVNDKGAIIANEGFTEAIKDSAQSGYNTTKAVTKAGYNAGMAVGKVPVIATTPAAAAVGTIAGSTIFATKSTLAIFKKGGNPIVSSGDLLEITFTDEMDIPVN